MTTDHKPDPEFVEYLENQVKNPHLSAATVMQMERVFIDQRERYEASLESYHRDLLAIHRVASHIAGVEPPTEDDTLTVKRIKQMAMLINRMSGWLDESREQQGGEAVAIGRIESINPMDFTGVFKWKPAINGNIPKSLEINAKLYIHPLQSQGVPEWMEKISSALKTQDNRITADPLFIVFQKGAVVVDEDYDHDRIVWVDDEGNEADDEVDAQLNWMRGDVDGEHFMDNEIELIDEDECREGWRRLAIKEVDEFVTACLTETGAESYLKVNGHNLRKPYIFVTSLFRNEEMKRLRDWLLSTPAAPQADEWVKCEDRLPTHSNPVQAITNDYPALGIAVVPARYVDGNGWTDIDNTDRGGDEAPLGVVIAWREMCEIPAGLTRPQPPEQGDGV